MTLDEKRRMERQAEQAMLGLVRLSEDAVAFSKCIEAAADVARTIGKLFSTLVLLPPEKQEQLREGGVVTERPYRLDGNLADDVG